MSLKSAFLKAAAHSAQGAVSAFHTKRMMDAPQPRRRKSAGGGGCVPCQARGRIYEAQKRAGIRSWYE
jgi:hypothetical protein